MKRLTTLGACALTSFALVGVTGATAGSDNANGGRSEAAKECAAMKKFDKAVFKATFGDHAMRACIKGEPVDPTVPEFKNAAKECLSERSADADLFHENYGTNGNHRNALGKCVVSKVKEDAPTPT